MERLQGVSPIYAFSLCKQTEGNRTIYSQRCWTVTLHIQNGQSCTKEVLTAIIKMHVRLALTEE
jgi:hypothetical protein